MKQIFFIEVFTVLVFLVNGSHFLGGTITWRPLNESATGSPVAIVITQTYSWTYSLMSCDNTLIANNQPVPAYGLVGSQTLSCIDNCGAGSAGYSNIGVLPLCTDFSSPVGTTVGQRSDIVYLDSGDNFSVAYQSSAWRALATSVGAAWSIASEIDLQPRPDNGLYNNAPVATMMSPIYIPVNQSTVINVPVADADGDTLRCRWSTNTNGVDECGGVCPPNSLPPNTVIYPNCTIIITGQNIGDWFGVTLMVEDFINSTSTTPLSSVPVQFLVQVVGPPLCTTPPEIIGELPEESCTSVIVGQPFTSELLAINNCAPSATIEDIATLSFSGMIKSDISNVNSTLYYKNLTWTPPIAQLGYQVMCAMAVDSQGAQSAQYCFKFYVSEDGVCSCPGYICISTTSTTTTTVTTSTTSITTTSTTSTTSTSTTSTSTTTATVTTTTKKPNPINWLLIGLIAGLFLTALILCSCLGWRYLRLIDVRRYPNKMEGTIELYHIERCIDPDCRWPNLSSPSNTFLTSQKKYLTYSASNESVNSFSTTRTAISNSTTNAKYRFRRKPMPGISVTKVKSGQEIYTVGNPDIRSPDRLSNEETNELPLTKLKNRGNVKISRIKSMIKPRPYSMDTYGQVNDTLKYGHKRSSTCQRTGGVKIVRVTNVRAKPSIQNSCQSINNQTACLTTIDETKEISYRCEVDNKKDKSTGRHGWSAYQQKEPDTLYLSPVDTNDLSPSEDPLKMSIGPVSMNTRDTSEYSVDVERPKIVKKNINLENNTLFRRLPFKWHRAKKNARRNLFKP